MVSLNMGQSYPFNQDEINRLIEPGRAGNYAYGYIDERGIFIVMYVGRSDNDLRQRIAHGIGEYAENPSLRYERFKFSYASTVQEAYEKECRNYHDFGGEQGSLANTAHPARPEGSFLHCPICGAPHNPNYADIFRI